MIPKLLAGELSCGPNATPYSRARFRYASTSGVGTSPQGHSGRGKLLASAGGETGLGTHRRYSAGSFSNAKLVDAKQADTIMMATNAWFNLKIIDLILNRVLVCSHLVL